MRSTFWLFPIAILIIALRYFWWIIIPLFLLPELLVVMVAYIKGDL